MESAPQNSVLPAGFIRASRTIRLFLQPAGQENSIQRLPYGGSKFYIVDADTDAEFGIKTDKTSQEKFTVGTGKDFEKTGENFFTAIEIENFTSDICEIILFAGFGEYIDKRTTIVGNRLSSILPTVEPDTRLLSVKVAAVPVASIAGGADILADGVKPTVAYLRRKAVMVSNLDPNLNLQLKDFEGNISHTIFAATAQIIPVSGPVTLHNPNGGAVSCQFVEIWWMKP